MKTSQRILLFATLALVSTPAKPMDPEKEEFALVDFLTRAAEIELAGIQLDRAEEWCEMDRKALDETVSSGLGDLSPEILGVDTRRVEDCTAEVADAEEHLAKLIADAKG